MLPYLPVYNRSDVCMVRGEGVYLFSDEDERYLDFASGIAVNALGHCHPYVNQALKDQADRLWHCSNLYRNHGLEKLARRFCEITFSDTVFFCNSGTEAVETGIKMIRKFHRANGAQERYRLVTFEGGFHGRSITGISAGGTEAARKGFEPLLEGFDRVAFNDLKAVKKAITKETAGILIEPVQAEGGIRVADNAFMQGLRELAHEHGLLLMLDEVQCGMGRPGTLFAYEQMGMLPDILVTAKGIGNGFPLAACMATQRASSGMTQGTHGSTYGSNPLAMAVGNAVLDVMLKPGFFDRVQTMGVKLKSELEKLAKEYPGIIEEVRGMGLILGIVPKVPHKELARRLRENGLLTAPAVSAVVRILPPLIIEEQHIDEAVNVMRRTFEEGV